MKKRIVALLPVIAALCACGNTNAYLANRTTTVEMYHIFDIKSSANTSVVAKAATDGLSRNTNDISTNLPLQMNVPVPSTPGRFTITDIGAKLGNSSMGTLMQLSSMQRGGATLKAASCDGAVWTARAQRTIANSSNLNLYACLYRYRDGYQLDTYAVFQKTEGGLTQLSRDLAHSLVGTPEEWVNKTILDMTHQIEVTTHAQVVHLEGQPELGNVPNSLLNQQK